jgi:extradiol dioxygenase family protein
MTEQQTVAEAGASAAALPFHLSTMCHSLAEARRFYGGILGCEERRATPTSVHFDLFGSQLTLHEVKDFNAETLQREVDAEEVPVPHFGGALDEVTFHGIAGRLREAGWSFVLEPHKRFIGKDWEQWVLFVLDPSGNAIELKSFTKAPVGRWV